MAQPIPPVPVTAVGPPVPVMDYTVRVELDTDTGTSDGFVEVALRWLDEGTRTLAADVRDALDSDPDPPWKRANDPYSPWGPPGAAWGQILLAHEREGGGGPPRYIHKPASDRGWQWLARQLRRAPWEATVAVSRLDDEGMPGSWCELSVSANSKAPGWIRLYRNLPSRILTVDAGGHEQQQRWLAFLRRYADRFNPSYGQIGAGHSNGSLTTLEQCLPVELGRNSPPYTVADSRRFLRGYTWLTVVARELAARLGGAAEMSAAGVFHEVAQLDAGGLWLQATKDFRDYGPAKAEQVFRVLAPVLRPGKPEPPMVDPRTGRPPHNEPYLLVYEDAAEAARHSNSKDQSP